MALLPIHPFVTMHAMKLWTFTLLLVLLGCASVLGSDLARENKHKCHWRRPKFCGDLDCPPYCVEKVCVPRLCREWQ